jgi:DNA-directed RNA polymerase specialized sigma24 family protein
MCQWKCSGARLRDHNLAEEAVQETFLSALKFVDQYRQSGSEGA